MSQEAEWLADKRKPYYEAMFAAISPSDWAAIISTAAGLARDGDQRAARWLLEQGGITVDVTGENELTIRISGGEK